MTENPKPAMGELHTPWSLFPNSLISCCWDHDGTCWVYMPVGTDYLEIYSHRFHSDNDADEIVFNGEQRQVFQDWYTFLAQRRVI